MNLSTIFLLAIGLSFDSFAVSVSSGVVLPGITFLKAVRIAFILAFFQALMPVIGWLAGSGISTVAKEYDPWIAFGLLTILGGKMIYESLKKDNSDNFLNPLDLKVTVSMAIATSIDALVVGLSLALLSSGRTIISMIVIIGAVTFIVSMIGMLFGKKVGSLLGRRMEILGGLILFAIGLKMLIDHLS
jgi:manganese efflux pump family protein